VSRFLEKMPVVLLVLAYLWALTLPMTSVGNTRWNVANVFLHGSDGIYADRWFGFYYAMLFLGACSHLCFFVSLAAWLKQQKNLAHYCAFASIVLSLAYLPIFAATLSKFPGYWVWLACCFTLWCISNMPEVTSVRVHWYPKFRARKGVSTHGLDTFYRP
jgi:hypothetical protein